MLMRRALVRIAALILGVLSAAPFDGVGQRRRQPLVLVWRFRDVVSARGRRFAERASVDPLTLYLVGVEAVIDEDEVSTLDISMDGGRFTVSAVREGRRRCRLIGGPFDGLRIGLARFGGPSPRRR